MVSAEKILSSKTDVENIRLKNDIKILKSKLSNSQFRTLELEGLLERYANLSAVEKYTKKPLQARKTSKHSGIAVIHWTDWHVAEIVQKSKTNGFNKFNPEICRQRVNALIEGTIKLVRLHRRDIEINELALILGGDFTTGYLHPELEQTNAMGPIEECYFAIELLEKGISDVFYTLKPKRLRVICHRGNHARTTRKMQYKNDFETSYETLIYWILRDRLSHESIEWVIDKNAICYTELMPGFNIRSFHGHQVRYSGGVGGLLVPMNKWVLKQNQTKKAVMSYAGHFHQYNQMKGIQVTGTLKGWDEYAMEFGFEYEPPSQSFNLFDCKRQMFTSSWPIICE